MRVFPLLLTCQGGVQEQWRQLNIPSGAAANPTALPGRVHSKIHQHRDSLYLSGREVNFLICVQRYRPFKAQSAGETFRH